MHKKPSDQLELPKASILRYELFNFLITSINPLPHSFFIKFNVRNLATAHKTDLLINLVGVGIG